MGRIVCPSGESLVLRHPRHPSARPRRSRARPRFHRLVAALTWMRSRCATCTRVRPSSRSRTTALWGGGRALNGRPEPSQDGRRVQGLQDGGDVVREPIPPERRMPALGAPPPIRAASVHPDGVAGRLPCVMVGAVGFSPAREEHAEEGRGDRLIAIEPRMGHHPGHLLGELEIPVIGHPRIPSIDHVLPVESWSTLITTASAPPRGQHGSIPMGVPT